MYSLFYLLTGYVLMMCGKMANALPANGSLPAKTVHAANPPHAMDACAQDPFFKVTRENIEESKVLEWFADWDANVDRESAEYKNSASYYDYIIQKFVSPSQPASCTVSDCTELRCEDFKLAKRMDRITARRVYFISICVKNIFKVARTIHIAETFIWQMNSGDEKKCKLLGGLVKAGISAAFIGIGAIPGAAPEAEAGAKTGVNFLKLGTDTSSSFTTQVGGLDIEKGICDAFPQPSQDLWPKIQAKMEHFLADSIQYFRTFLEADFHSIIMGNLTTNGTSNGTFGSSKLAEKVLSEEYFILSPEILALLQTPAELTEQMRKPFIEKAISTCLRLGQCSIHCVNETVHPRGAEEDMASSRFNPRPGVWCQYQCWRDSTTTKNLELFGLKALQEGTFAKVTLEDLGRHAYDDWEANRYRAPNITDFSVESFNAATNDESPIMSGDHLPVCFSDMGPHDFHQKENADKVLSCFCGDMYGNETAAFFNAMHIEEWDGFKAKGLHNACDTSYKKDRTSPLTTSMGYCRLAEAGLAIDDGQKLEPDKRCDEFTKEVQKLTDVNHHDIKETNRLMRLASPLGANLCQYPGQQDAAANRNSRYDFCKACKAFLQQE